MEFKELVGIALRNDEYELRQHSFYSDKINKRVNLHIDSLRSNGTLNYESSCAAHALRDSLIKLYTPFLPKIGFKIKRPFCHYIFKCNNCHSIGYTSIHSDLFIKEFKDSLSWLAINMYLSMRGNKTMEEYRYKRDKILEFLASQNLYPHNVNPRLFSLDKCVLSTFNNSDLAQIIELDEPEFKIAVDDPVTILKMRRLYPSYDMVYVMEMYKLYNDIEL